ncbi:MAG TPA: DNA cytosine methyltransferase [Candidatus Obscuribacterales bacterium]
MGLRMSYRPRVLDLFCGAGGLSLGFEKAGCQIIGGVDFESWPVKTHHRNFPNCEVQLGPTDISQLDPAGLGLQPGSIDILIGGPPCQGFSQVGRAKIRSLGQEWHRDRKNRLYRQFIRFLHYFKPVYFVIENVQALRTFKESRFLSELLDELSHGYGDYILPPKMRYDVSYRVLCAADYGVPQVRYRLFVIGRRKDHPELAINFPEPTVTRATNLRDAISDLPRLCAPVLSTKTSSYLINGGVKQDDRPKRYRSSPRNAYQRLMRAESGEFVLNHICRGHNSKDLKIFALLKQGQKYKDLPARLRRYRDDIFDDKYRRLKENEPCWTLTAHMQKDCLAYIHPRQTRSLSAREAARVQSFPDSFVFEGPLTKVFRQIGNAVPPLLAQEVARILVDELERARAVDSMGFYGRACAGLDQA